MIKAFSRLLSSGNSNDFNEKSLQVDALVTENLKILINELHALFILLSYGSAFETSARSRASRSAYQQFDSIKFPGDWIVQWANRRRFERPVERCAFFNKKNLINRVTKKAATVFSHGIMRRQGASVQLIGSAIEAGASRHDARAPTFNCQFALTLAALVVSKLARRLIGSRRLFIGALKTRPLCVHCADQKSRGRGKTHEQFKFTAICIGSASIGCACR